MSSKHEIVRQRVKNSASPLRNHSLDSRNTKASLDGQKRIRFGESHPPGRVPRPLRNLTFWERARA